MGQPSIYGDLYTHFPSLSLSDLQVANSLIKMKTQTFQQLHPYQNRDYGLTKKRQCLITTTNSKLSHVTL